MGDLLRTTLTAPEPCSRGAGSSGARQVSAGLLCTLQSPQWVNMAWSKGRREGTTLQGIQRTHTALQCKELNSLGLSIPSFSLDMWDNGCCVSLSSTLHTKVRLSPFLLGHNIAAWCQRQLEACTPK